MRGFDDPKLGRQAGRDWHRGDRHVHALPLVKFDHVANVHPVHVIGAEDGHQMVIHVFDQIEVLINRVGRALVPRLFGGAHLGRDRNNELLSEQAAKLPAIPEVP